MLFNFMTKIDILSLFKRWVSSGYFCEYAIGGYMGKQKSSVGMLNDEKSVEKHVQKKFDNSLYNL